MEFIPFMHKCPEVAEKETRTVMVLDEKLYGIPEGQYAFIESYCADPKCDCRKVMINVIRVDDQSGENIGTISYGWEKLSFYTKWLYGNSEVAKEMKGPCIEPGGRFSKNPEAAIKLFKKAGLDDSTFTKRLPEHYKLFKEIIKKEVSNPVIIETEKISRNAPCPCGSGKKYKKCCLNKTETTKFSVPEYDEIDTLMMKGWDLIQKKKTAKGCDVWLELWEKLKLSFKPEFKDIQEAETMFSGNNCIFNWCQDLEMELGNIREDDYYQKRIIYCEEFCSIFPESDEQLIFNMKEAIAESHFAIGNFDEGEKCFKELVEIFPNNIWGYINWGDMYLWPRNKGVKPDYEKAEQLYNMALDKDLEDEDALIDRLEELKKEREKNKK